MKAFLFSLLFGSLALAAQVEMGDLPLNGDGSTINPDDSFPYVDSMTNTSRRLNIYELVHVPPIALLIPVSTKGDLFTYTTHPARLAAGADGQILTSDSTQSTGLRWVSGATGTVTSITAGDGLTGGVITGSGTIALSSPVDFAHGGTGNNTVLSSGSVPYSDGTKLTENNSNFFWDDLNKTLDIGTSSTVTAAGMNIVISRNALGGIYTSNPSIGTAAVSGMVSQSGANYGFIGQLGVGYTVAPSSAGKYGVSQLVGNGLYLNAPTSKPIEFAQNTAVKAGVPVGGGFFVSSGSNLTTSAVNGFLYAPNTAGVPLGTPTAITGSSPLTVDLTDDKLYFYTNGAWHTPTSGATAPADVNMAVQYNNTGSFGGDAANFSWDDSNRTLELGSNVLYVASGLNVDRSLNSLGGMFARNPNAGANAYAGIKATNGTGTAEFVMQGTSNSQFPNRTFVNADAASTGVAINAQGGDVRMFTAGVEGYRLDTNKSSVFNITGLSTSDTGGFVYLPTSPGTPTGVPLTEGGTNTAAIEIDRTNNLFYFYTNGSWHTPSAGSGGRVVNSVGTSFSIPTLSADYLLIDNTSSTNTITLPDATLSNSFCATVKNIGANTANIARSGSDTIDGASSDALALQYESKTYCAVSGSWYIN